MPSRLLAALALALATFPGVALAGPDPSCGPHEHVVSERDEEEGSTVKRCVCDDGYQSEGPGKPCKPVAGAAGNAPGSKDGKKDKGDKKPAK